MMCCFSLATVQILFVLTLIFNWFLCTLISWFVCVHKTLHLKLHNKSNSRKKKGFFGSQFRRQSIIVGMLWRQEVRAAVHRHLPPGSGEKRTPVLSLFPPPSSVQDPTHGMALSTSPLNLETPSSHIQWSRWLSCWHGCAGITYP